MSDLNGYDTVLKLDHEKRRIEQLVMSLYHNILRDYTAYANRDDITEGLYKFFTREDITIISKMQLKQYEEMEKSIIDANLLTLNKNV